MEDGFCADYADLENGSARTLQTIANNAMKNFILLSLLLLVLGTTAIAQNNLPPEVRETARKVMMPVVYKVPGMDKVKVVENLKYTKSDDPNILMDVYLPPDLAKANGHGIAPSERN